jgi:hypothetical protein
MISDIDLLNSLWVSGFGVVFSIAQLLHLMCGGATSWGPNTTAPTR